MIVIVCTEDRGGMLFNNRRVSKDRTVIQKILELSEGKKLWIHPFSEKLFELFHGDIYTEFHCSFSASLHSCDLLIGQTLKIVEDQPPFLYFGQFGDRPM